MADVITVINRLAGAGIDLKLKEGRLVTEAPEGAITADVAESIRASKQKIIEFLRTRDALNSRRTTAIAAAPEHEREQLSFSQRRLWLIDRLTGRPAAHNIPVAIRT